MSDLVDKFNDGLKDALINVIKMSDAGKEHDNMHLVLKCLMVAAAKILEAGDGTIVSISNSPCQCGNCTPRIIELKVIEDAKYH